MRHPYQVDFMAIGAHADDVELTCGGTIAKMTNSGQTGVLVDMTKASAATRGSVETRMEEAKASAQVLGVQERLNLGFPDAKLQCNEETVYAVAELIRKYRPKLILTHVISDYHPDHNTTHQIVKEAWYKAGLRALEIQGEAFRAHRLIYFIGAEALEPDFAVDISDYWQTKMEAMACFPSQFAVKGTEEFEGNTYISSNAFMEKFEARHRVLGLKILKKYAEGFQMEFLPEIEHPGLLEGETY